MKAPSRIAWKETSASRHLGTLLLVAFFGTIVFFLLSALAANYRERGIIRASENISEVALPAIQHLAAARTELRQMEVLLNDLTGGVTSERRPEELQAELKVARERLNEDYRAYKVLPAYRGENPLQETAEEALRSVSASYDAALLRLQAGDEQRARFVRNAQATPALERVDSALLALVNLNALAGAEQSQNISKLRGEAIEIGTFLHVLSAICAAIAGVLAFRVVRRFAKVMNLRVSELEHFAGRVAHDIRSPLSSVGMALELAKKDPQLEEKTRSRLERSGRTVQRIGQLVDGLLVFAVSGAPPPTGTRADIQEVLAGVLEGMQPGAQETDIDLQSEKVELGAVACSPGVLTSLFANLIGNAIKYMGDVSARKVIVRARDAGAMMRIEVQDTGPGVPRELRQNIFDPYVRAATSSGIAGLGLGLATVRRLVEAHGGSVGVGANPEGGSVFWFQLPKAPASAEEPRAVP